MNSQVIGTIAATLTTLAYLPQAYKIFKTQDTKAISLFMFILMNLGVFLWLLYGIQIEEPPIIWSNMITLALAGYILYIKIKNVITHKEKL